LFLFKNIEPSELSLSGDGIDNSTFPAPTIPVLNMFKKEYEKKINELLNQSSLSLSFFLLLFITIVNEWRRIFHMTMLVPKTCQKRRFTYHHIPSSNKTKKVPIHHHQYFLNLIS